MIRQYGGQRRRRGAKMPPFETFKDAASRAQRAADFLHGLQPQQMEQDRAAA